MNENEKSREKKLVDQVRIANQRLLQTTRNAARAFIELGQHLNDLKEEIKCKKKGRWTKYCDEEMPWLNLRRAQRAMKVAKLVDLEKIPGAENFSQRNLLQLASFSGDGTLAKKLEDNGIDCNFSVKEQDKTKDFEEKVDKLIKDLRKKRNGKKPDLNKLLSKSVGNLEQKVNEIAKAGTHAQLRETDLKEIKIQLSSILHKINEFMQFDG